MASARFQRSLLSPREYGLINTLFGLNRSPLRGSSGPSMRNAYSIPAGHPRTNTCQKWNVLLANGSRRMSCTGSAGADASNSISTTSVAPSEKSEKLTPSGEIATPMGCADPGSVTNGAVDDAAELSLVLEKRGDHFLRTTPDTTFPPRLERKMFAIVHVVEKRFLEFTRERSIVDANVAFLVVGKRPVVEVGRANC